MIGWGAGVEGERGFLKEAWQELFMRGLMMAFVCASPVAHQFGSVLSPTGIIRERLRGRIRTLFEEIAQYRNFSCCYDASALYGEIVRALVTF